MVAPRHLSAVFLLVMALFTSLPLPALLSLFLSLLVSGLHLFALATYGKEDQMEEEEVDAETSIEHFQRVRLVECCSYSFYCTLGVPATSWILTGDCKKLSFSTLTKVPF